FSGTFTSEDVSAGDFSSFATGELKYVMFGSRSGRDVPRIAMATAAHTLTAAGSATFTECTAPLGVALERLQLTDRVFGAIKTTEADSFKELDRIFAGSVPAELKTIAGECTKLLEQ